MRQLFEKFYTSKVLLTSGILFFVIGGVLVVRAVDVNDEAVDTDGDSIVDAIDQCPGTMIDKPTGDLGVNHHIWIGGDRFTVLVPNKGDKDKVPSDYTMLATKGCSCGDILKALSKKGTDVNVETRQGCTEGTLGSWTKK